jgi:hypothetical protein
VKFYWRMAYLQAMLGIISAINGERGWATFQGLFAVTLVLAGAFRKRKPRRVPPVSRWPT